MSRLPSPDEQAELAELRAQIDAVDAQLAGLLCERAALVAAVWARKEQAGLAVLDPDREQQIAGTYATRCVGLAPDDVSRFVNAVLRVRARNAAALEGSGGAG